MIRAFRTSGKKKTYFIIKSYFIYFTIYLTFQFLFFTSYSILFNFLLVSLYFSHFLTISLTSYQCLSIFTHKSNPIAKKKKKINHISHHHHNHTSINHHQHKPILEIISKNKKTCNPLWYHRQNSPQLTTTPNQLTTTIYHTIDQNLPSQDPPQPMTSTPPRPLYHLTPTGSL